MTPTLPAVPNDPATRILVYDDPAEVSAALGVWKNRDAARDAQASADAAMIADLRSQVASLTPATPIKWGSSAGPINGETQVAAIARVKSVLAPEVIRFFVAGVQMPFWPTTTGDTQLSISFHLNPADVLAGKHDAGLKAFFEATPRDSYWTYWHEPEDDIARGAFTAAQFRQAFAHVAAIARASSKASLLRSTLILMGYSTNPASGRTWTDYYPGSDVIDVLAWDCYCVAANTTAAQAYDAAHAASVAAGKPFAITETGAGSVQYGSARAARLTEMSDHLSKLSPPPEFVCYFDSDPPGNAGSYPGQYGWHISNIANDAKAWKAGQSA